jgi:hypothetical protein
MEGLSQRPLPAKSLSSFHSSGYFQLVRMLLLVTYSEAPSQVLCFCSWPYGLSMSPVHPAETEVQLHPPTMTVAISSQVHK